MATRLSWLSLPVWSHVALSKILGACMHHTLPFIFRPLRNTHLKCLLVSLLHFVLVFMNKVPFDTGTEREVVPMLELRGGVYCFRQNTWWISRLFGWTVTTPQCCGGWHEGVCERKGVWRQSEKTIQWEVACLRNDKLIVHPPAIPSQHRRASVQSWAH